VTYEMEPKLQRAESCHKHQVEQVGRNIVDALPHPSRRHWNRGKVRVGQAGLIKGRCSGTKSDQKNRVKSKLG